MGVCFLLLEIEGRGFEARPPTWAAFEGGRSQWRNRLPPARRQERGSPRVRRVFPTFVVASGRPTGHGCSNTEPKRRGHR